MCLNCGGRWDIARAGRVQLAAQLATRGQPIAEQALGAADAGHGVKQRSAACPVSGAAGRTKRQAGHGGLVAHLRKARGKNIRPMASGAVRVSLNKMAASNG